MHLTLVRSATLLVDMAGRRFLVDPMLDPAGARGAIAGTADPRPNPLVGLPMAPEAVLDGVDAVLVTHLHADHLDETATSLLRARRLPIACQREDEPALHERGLGELRPVDGALDLCGIGVARTMGRHGTGEIGRRMGTVAGFVLGAPGEPVLYIAGDTIWCDEVDQAISDHAPDVIVVNAGAARFLEGDPIIMDADDVVSTARAAPAATIVAVHLEALNHCALTREDLRAAVDAAGVGDRVRIPADGETLSS
jgi:L-ascorbate metabolism protein UlaG (beta-lactamase superfamily)